MVRVRLSPRSRWRPWTLASMSPDTQRSSLRRRRRSVPRRVPNPRRVLSESKRAWVTHHFEPFATEWRTSVTFDRAPRRTASRQRSARATMPTKRWGRHRCSRSPPIGPKSVSKDCDPIRGPAGRVANPNASPTRRRDSAWWADAAVGGSFRWHAHIAVAPAPSPRPGPQAPNRFAVGDWHRADGGITLSEPSDKRRVHARDLGPSNTPTPTRVHS